MSGSNSSGSKGPSSMTAAAAATVEPYPAPGLLAEHLREALVRIHEVEQENERLRELAKRQIERIEYRLEFEVYDGPLRRGLVSQRREWLAALTTQEPNT